MKTAELSEETLKPGKRSCNKKRQPRNKKVGNDKSSQNDEIMGKIKNNKMLKEMEPLKVNQTRNKSSQILKDKKNTRKHGHVELNRFLHSAQLISISFNELSVNTSHTCSPRLLSYDELIVHRWLCGFWSYDTKKKDQCQLVIYLLPVTSVRLWSLSDSD